MRKPPRVPSSEEAREMQKKSAEARKRNTAFRNTFRGALKAFLSGDAAPGVSGAEAVVMWLVESAKDGNVAAAKLLYEMSGESSQKIEIEQKTPETKKIPQSLKELYEMQKKALEDK